MHKGSEALGAGAKARHVLVVALDPRRRRRVGPSATFSDIGIGRCLLPAMHRILDCAHLKNGWV
jgi:hypothetical protein